MPRQKSLGIPTLACQFEGAEVLPPRAVGHFGIVTDPDTERQQVILRDFPLTQPFDKVLLQTKGKGVPTDLRLY